jgi:predicted nucleic acid-binding Zn ribbon protein
MPTTAIDPILTSFTLNLRNLVDKFSTLEMPQPDMAHALEMAATQFRATPRPCAVCGLPILIGKGHHSKNRKFCSNRCRVQDYRLRHHRTTGAQP